MSKSLSELASDAKYQNWVRKTYCSNDYHNLEYLTEYYNFVVGK